MFGEIAADPGLVSARCSRAPNVLLKLYHEVVVRTA
jgi:hypothetical protein